MGLTKVRNILDITADTMADLLNAKHKKGSIELLGFHTKGDGGGGVFIWDATANKNTHNGGTIIDPDNAADLGTWDAAAQTTWFTAGTGTGCWVRKTENSPTNVKVFGAKDGADSTLSIQAAADLGNILIDSSTTTIVSDTINITGLYLDGKINVSGDPTSGIGSVLFYATADGSFVTGDGVIEGVGVNSFSGIQLEGVLDGYVSDVSIVNLSPGNATTSRIAVYLVECFNSTVSDIYIYNCGGWGINVQGSKSCKVINNSLLRIGYAGINSSANLGTKIKNNDLSYIGYFGVKGGYGYATTISNDITPTVDTFSIPSSGSYYEGQAITIAETVNTNLVGYIKSVVDNGTYYTITVRNSFSAPPTIGKIIEAVDTETVVDSNIIENVTDNGMDLNIVDGYVITNNQVRRTGTLVSYLGVPALSAGIWIGADPQGANQGWQSSNLIISKNTVQETGGAGIQLMATGSNVVVSDNVVKDYSRDATTSYSGIEINSLTYQPCFYVSVLGNLVKNTDQYPNTGGIYLNYIAQAKVQNNLIECPKPLKVYDPLYDVSIEGNSTRANVDNVSGLEVGGTQPNLGITKIKNNYMSFVGTLSTAINVTTANLIGISEMEDNFFSGTVTELATASTFERGILTQSSVKNIPIDAGFKIGANSRSTVALEVATTATQKIGTVLSDPGTVGGMFIKGFARSGTSAFEAFEVMFYGNTAMPTVVFTSLGSPNATSFLSAGDFTINVSGGTIECRYTNNELNTVYMNLEVDALSRF